MVRFIIGTGKAAAECYPPLFLPICLSLFPPFTLTGLPVIVTERVTRISSSISYAPSAVLVKTTVVHSLP